MMDIPNSYPRSRSTSLNLRMKQWGTGQFTITHYLTAERLVPSQILQPKRWPAVSPHASMVTQFPDKLDHARAKQHGDLCLWRISATVGLLQQRRKRQLLLCVWQSLLLGFYPLCSRPSDEIELRKLKPVRRRFISFASIPTIQFLFCLGNSSSCTSLSVTASLCHAIYEDSRFSSLRYWQVWMKDKK